MIVTARVHVLVLADALVIVHVRVSVIVLVVVHVGVLNMKKPPLEFCIANISDNFSIKRINNIVEYVETLSFKYSKVRVMLDFNGENVDLINSMLPFIKKSKLENFVIAILGNAKDVAKLSNLQKTGLSAFIKIEDYLDVQKIEEIKIPVEAVIMRLTP